MKADSKLQINDITANIIVTEGPASLSTQHFPSVRLPSQVKHMLRDVSDKVHTHNPWKQLMLKSRTFQMS